MHRAIRLIRQVIRFFRNFILIVEFSSGLVIEGFGIFVWINFNLSPVADAILKCIPWLKPFCLSLPLKLGNCLRKF